MQSEIYGKRCVTVVLPTYSRQSEHTFRFCVRVFGLFDFFIGLGSYIGEIKIYLDIDIFFSMQSVPHTGPPARWVQPLVAVAISYFIVVALFNQEIAHEGEIEMFSSVKDTKVVEKVENQLKSQLVGQVLRDPLLPEKLKNNSKQLMETLEHFEQNLSPRLRNIELDYYDEKISISNVSFFTHIYLPSCKTPDVKNFTCPPPFLNSFQEKFSRREKVKKVWYGPNFECNKIAFIETQVQEKSFENSQLEELENGLETFLNLQPSLKATIEAFTTKELDQKIAKTTEIPKFFHFIDFGCNTCRIFSKFSFL